MQTRHRTLVEGEWETPVCWRGIWDGVVIVIVVASKAADDMVGRGTMASHSTNCSCKTIFGRPHLTGLVIT